MLKNLSTYEASEVKIRVKNSAYRVKWLVQAEMCSLFYIVSCVNT